MTVGFHRQQLGSPPTVREHATGYYLKDPSRQTGALWGNAEGAIHLLKVVELFHPHQIRHFLMDLDEFEVSFPFGTLVQIFLGVHSSHAMQEAFKLIGLREQFGDVHQLGMSEFLYCTVAIHLCTSRIHWGQRAGLLGQ